MRSIIFLAVAFAATPAEASAWFMVTPATSNLAAVQMADAASIRNDGQYIEIWTHLFYKEPVNGVKSYMMQFAVDCERRMARQKRYIDYDENFRVIDSGDSSPTADGAFRSMAPDTIGDLTITFACSTPEYRKHNYLSIAPSQDYHAIAKFFLEPGELVKTK